MNNHEEHLKRLTYQNKHLSKLNHQQKKVINRLRLSLKALIASVLIVGITIISVQIPENYALVEKPVTHKATMQEKRENRLLAQQIASAGWDWKGIQWKCADKLFMAESKYDQYADNKHSTAYGIGQVLSETSSVPAIQITRAYKYIETRYTTPCHAWIFHLRKNYY